MKKIFILGLAFLILLPIGLCETTVFDFDVDDPAKLSTFGLGATWVTIADYHNITSTDTINKIHIKYESGGSDMVTEFRCYYKTGTTFTLRSIASNNVSLRAATVNTNITNMTLSGCQVGDVFGWYAWSGRIDPMYTGTAGHPAYWKIDQCNPTCDTTTMTSLNRDLAIAGYSTTGGGGGGDGIYINPLANPYQHDCNLEDKIDFENNSLSGFTGGNLLNNCTDSNYCLSTGPAGNILKQLTQYNLTDKYISFSYYSDWFGNSNNVVTLFNNSQGNFFQFEDNSGLWRYYCNGGFSGCETPINSNMLTWYNISMFVHNNGTIFSFINNTLCGACDLGNVNVTNISIGGVTANHIIDNFIVSDNNNTWYNQTYIFNASNSSDIILSSVEWDFSNSDTTYSENPLNFSVCNFINYTNPKRNITIEIEDLLGEYQPLSDTIELNSSKFNHDFTMFSWAVEFGLCGSLGQHIMNFTFYNEDSPTTPINLTMEFSGEYWTNNRSRYTNFSHYFNNYSSYSLCIQNDTNTTFYSDIYLKYYDLNGYYNRFYLVNATLNISAPKNYTLYELNASTGLSDLKLTVRYRTSYFYYPYIIATLQRQYLDEGIWRNVQMDESGDFGSLSFYIYEKDINYRLVFLDRYSNTVLSTSNSLKFVCDPVTGLCEYTYLLDETTAQQEESGVSFSNQIDNSTGIITINWTNSEPESKTINVKVIKDTASNSITVCDTTQAGAGGSVNCNVSMYSGSVKVISSVDGEVDEINNIELFGLKLGNLVGKTDGALYAFIMALLIIGFGLISPVIALISIVIALIFIFWLGLVSGVTMAMIIAAGAVSLIISLKLRD